VRVAEAEAIKADIDIARNICVSWKTVRGIVDLELVKAEKKFAEAYSTWMKPTEIE